MTAAADHLRALMKSAGITRAEAAVMLHVSVHTLAAWMKPETTKSANPCPEWAPELLAFKTGQATPASGQDKATAVLLQTAPLMQAVLQEALEAWKGVEIDDHMNASEAVTWVRQWLPKAKAVIEAAG